MAWQYRLILGLLVVTAFLPAPVQVVDLLTGEPVSGARLEALNPTLRALIEPIYGPLHTIGGLPLLRVLSFLCWLAAIVFAVRVWRKPRAAAWQVLRLFGAAAPLAAIPMVLSWFEIVSTDHVRPLMISLPVCAYLVLMGIVLVRRRKFWWRATDAFVGLVGYIAIGTLLMVITPLPCIRSVGMRLVAPPEVYTADLHAHSLRWKDALMDDHERLEFFHRHGVDMSAITEHNYFDNGTEPTDPNYTSMAKFVRERGWDMNVLPGEEFTTHALHLILLGIHKTYIPRDYRLPDHSKLEFTPPTFGYDFKRLIDDVHRDGGYVVVAHWWMFWTYVKVDWRLLVEYGVDGFEVTNDADWAPRELIEEWKKAGKLLVTGTDFHGWRKSIYCWNLIDRASIDRENAVDGIFKNRKLRPVAAATHDPRVPAWLDPPVTVVRYLVGLGWGNRGMWVAIVLLVWAISLKLRRRPVRP